MNKKLSMSGMLLLAITLAGCAGASSSSASSTPSSSSASSASSSVAVDGAVAKLQTAYDSLGALITDPNNITVGFQVPAQLANSVQAVWSSNQPGVISFGTASAGFINATVNRPAKGAGDASVTISAALSLQSELSTAMLTQTWSLALTVKENTVAELVIENIADILEVEDPAYDGTFNVVLQNMTIFGTSVGEAWAYDGTGIIQIYGGAASTMQVGKVYTVSGTIEWYYGIWEIVRSTATEQTNATPQLPTKQTISSVANTISTLVTAGEHLPASGNASNGNFEPIYARVTGKIYMIPNDTSAYNTYLLDSNNTGFVAGAGDVPANGLMFYYGTDNFALIRQYVGIEVTIDVIIYTYRSNNRAFAIYYVGGADGITATLTDEQKLTIDAAAISVPASITEATTLPLPTTGANGATISWSSSKDAVINATTGVVTLANPAEVVTLTATVTVGTLTAVVRTFEVVVGQLQNTTMANLLTKAKGNIAYSEGEVLYVSANKREIVIGDSTGFGYIRNAVALDVTVGQFIGVNYTVDIFRGLLQMTAVSLLTPKGTDPNLTVTPEVWTAVQANALTEVEFFNPRLVTMELVGHASSSYTNGYLAGFGTKFVQTNGAPSTLRDKKFTVTGWILGRGSSTFPVPAPSITLISTLDYANVVAAATDPTDTEKLALAAEQFRAPAANPALTSDLTLPTTGLFGSTVAWTSSKPNVISTGGLILRPEIGQPDEVVSLSYVITLGTLTTQSVSIEFTVKANEAVVVVPTQDLFISEYIEGSSNNKAIEIYNPTAAAVDLSGYSVVLYSNGAGLDNPGNTLALTGTLAAGDVFVIANSSANADILAVSDVTSNVTFYNGDDALGLFKGTTLIDVFGVIGVDPGSSWAVGTGFTADYTLVRKPSVTMGATTWNPEEWDVLPQDTVSSLGSHTMTTPSELFISEYIEGSSNNKAIEIYNPTAAAVDLSEYTISLFTNGSTTPTSLTLSGTLNAGDVYVIANSSANAEILAVADLVLSFVSGQFGANWNGDDAIGLYKGTTLIDVFGVIGVDPGSSWAVGTGFTADYTLVRKPSVTMGATTWNPEEWEVLPNNTTTSLGSHTVS